MLGHIFENLLEDNKDKGAFYTPKEIVQYMCQESLIEYLNTKLSDTIKDEKLPEAIRSFVLKQTFSQLNDLSQSADRLILQALKEVKICDPAIGSGAFPMGILHEIFRMLEQHEGSDVFASVWGMDNWEAARIKEEIIQNSIYGVDIEKGAVDIARLRFWLSIIIDEEEPRPLPNLDYKIMQGNSLLEQYEDIDLSVQFRESTELFTDPNTFQKEDVEKLLKKVEAYYHAETEVTDESGKSTKDQIKSEIEDIVNKFLKDRINEKLDSNLKHIDEVQNQLIIANRQHPKTKAEEIKKEKALRKNTAVLEKLLKEKDRLDHLKIDLAKIQKTKTYPFFLWHLWFYDVFSQGGFDIVIGNPPYGVSIKGEEREMVVSNHGKVPDYEIYYFFIELSKSLLKKNGLKSYIIPNTFLFNTFAGQYRLNLLETWDIIEILDCTKFNIFQTATVRNAITLFKKSSDKTLIGYRNTRNVESFNQLISRDRSIIKIDEIKAMNQNWGLVFSLKEEVINLITSVKTRFKPASEYFNEVSQGLIAYDKYQGQSKETIKSRAYHYKSFAKPELKKWLLGADINRYKVEWNGQNWIDYCDGIANPRDPKFFLGKRILVREITNPSIFAGLTDQELYNDPSLLIIKNSELYSLNVFLAILNSKFGTFFHFNSSPKATKGAFPKILIKDINEFPIPEVSDKTKNMLEELTGELLNEKTENGKRKTIEEKIDHLIFRLYSLNYEEALIVDPELTLTKDEYNNISID